MSAVESEALLEHVERACTEYCAERKEHTLVVGLSRHGERVVKGFRSPDARFVDVPNGRTLYEIGSVSKVYTTSLLSILVSQGLLALEDTVGQYYPQLNLKPEIAEVTLFDLATHSSGLDGDGIVLARLIKEAVDSGDFANYTYYERYGLAELHEELEVARLVRPRGSGWEYSRTGLSILGHILTLATGKAYDALLQEYLCQPLGLTDTVCTLTDEQQSRLVHGFSSDGTPSLEWHWGVMLPQGGIRATTDDMLTFLEANMAEDDTPLSAAFRRSRETEVVFPEGAEDLPPFPQALGWMNLPLGQSSFTHHTGATFSYMAVAGYDITTKTAVSVMTSSEKNLDDHETFPVFAFQLAIKAILEASH